MLGCGCHLFAQTELYNKYASKTNIKVACVNNMALDSVSKVDVTLLEALDDEGWGWMLKEFNISEQVQGEMSMMFSMRNKHDPAKSAPIVNEIVDISNSCYVCVDYQKRTIYIFTLKAGAKKDVIVKYLLDKMIGNN